MLLCVAHLHHVVCLYVGVFLGVSMVKGGPCCCASHPLWLEGGRPPSQCRCSMALYLSFPLCCSPWPCFSGCCHQTWVDVLIASCTSYWHCVKDALLSRHCSDRLIGSVGCAGISIDINSLAEKGWIGIAERMTPALLGEQCRCGTA